MSALKSDLEKYLALARRKSKLGLQNFLDLVSVETADKRVRRFLHVKEPWQQQLLDPLIPAVEQACGLHDNYRGPQKFFLTLPKGHAKTTKIALLVTWAVCFAPRPIKAVVAAGDRGQANLLLEAIETVKRENYWLADLFKTINYEASGPGGTLEVLSSDADTASGILPDIIIVDELTFWKKPDLYHVLDLGSHKRPRCVFIVITNAGIISTWQHQILQQAKADPALWFVHDRPGHKASWLSQERIAKERRGKPPGLARRMYDNEWVRPDETDAFATREQCEACVDPQLEPTTHGHRSHDYVTAIDLGVSKDRAVGVVVHRDADGVIALDQMRVWVPTPGNRVQVADVKAWLAEVHQNYPLAQLVLDPWNLEDVAQEYEQDRRVEVTRYSFQGQGHMKLAENLRTLLADRRLKLYADAGRISLPDGTAEDLIDEMSGLIIEYGKDGKTYRFNHLPGKHDDRTCALALAALGCVQLDAPVTIRGEDFIKLSRDRLPTVRHSPVPKSPTPPAPQSVAEEVMPDDPPDDPESEEADDMTETKYPDVRFFHPNGEWQPTPQGVHQPFPTFKTQDQAQYAKQVFYSLTGRTPPAYDRETPQLKAEARFTVEKKISEFCRDNHIPVKEQAPESVAAGND